MVKHSSAIAREETPHENYTTRTNTIMNALTRRAQAILNDDSIDTETRAIIRYGLETHDPWLAQLVRRADKRRSAVETFDFSQVPKTDECASTRETNEVNLKPEINEDDSTNEKIEALAEIICRAGDQSAAALFVLMGILGNSTDPKALANTAKHFAFTRCGELNLFGMVDAQLAAVEDELLVGNTLMP